MPCPVAAIRSRIEQTVTDDTLRKKGEELKHEYSDIFPPDIPDTAELPDEVLMRIKLRDEITPMVARAYSCPKKYRAGWKTLIEQHLAAGHIRPSNSDYVSPAFIVPKSDPSVLPLGLGLIGGRIILYDMVSYHRAVITPRIIGIISI